MAAGNVARVIRAPGRIVIDPTDAFSGNAFPYSGTEIGKTNVCVLQPLGVPFRVESEALGEATDVLEANKRYVFSCFVRGWDNDAIAQMLTGNNATGAITQHTVFVEPGTTVPGESASGRAVKVAYVPDDTIHVPAVMIYSGIPHWTDGAELAFQRGSELGISLSIECLRNSNGNILRVGRIEDLALT